jgi:MEDS: MEthanogen/methylotroph, DcmR Sensory domain
MSSWKDLLKRAAPGGHLVQLYGKDDRLLAKNVSRFLAEGLPERDSLIVIATPEHTESIARYLTEEAGTAALEAEREGRLVYLDARATLDQLLRKGQPDPVRFDAVIGELLRSLRARSGSGKVRAFGEMVNLLWSDGRHEEAERLEDLWNGLLAGSQYSLYCAYAIDLFSSGSDPARLSPIVDSHTHLFAGPGTILSSRRASA